MSTFVLIHGSWHGGWCWEQLAPLLEAKGHRVLMPDLPGMGSNRMPFAEDVHGQWVDAIAALVAEQPEPVVLLGHSRGGVTASAVAERHPDRIQLLVFLAATVLADGQSMLEVNGASDEVYASVIPSEDGVNCRIDPAAARRLFYNDVSDEEAERASAKLASEPMRVYGARAELSDARFGRVPRSYIETTQDLALPLSLQKESQARHPMGNVVSLPSGHSPFYSMPARLAEDLHRMAAK